MRWCLRNGIDPYCATAAHVAAFCADYRDHASQLSLLRRYASVKAFYHYLVAAGEREDNPAMAVKVKVPPREAKEPFTEDELRRIVAATRALRDRALVRFLIGTGVRLQELLRMRLHHIDWEKGMVLIEGKGFKRRRLAPGDRAMWALREYVDERAAAVWMGPKRPMTAQGIYLALKRVGDRARVSHIHPYRFRTTFAVRFAKMSGGDIQSLRVLMGHSKIESTLHYAAWGEQERALDQQRRLGLGDRL